MKWLISLIFGQVLCAVSFIVRLLQYYSCLVNPGSRWNNSLKKWERKGENHEAIEIARVLAPRDKDLTALDALQTERNAYKQMMLNDPFFEMI
jgi:hypothetical protein